MANSSASVTNMRKVLDIFINNISTLFGEQPNPVLGYRQRVGNKVCAQIIANDNFCWVFRH